MFPALAQPTPARVTCPARPAQPGRPVRTSLIVLVALIWSVPVAATAVLGFLVVLGAVWGAASGESPLLFLVGALGVAVAGAAVLAGVYFAPVLRRVSPCGRWALMGVVAWPGPVLLLACMMNG